MSDDSAGLSDDDYERIRRFLTRRRMYRSPDDLRPADNTDDDT